MTRLEVKSLGVPDSLRRHCLRFWDWSWCRRFLCCLGRLCYRLRWLLGRFGIKSQIVSRMTHLLASLLYLLQPGKISLVLVSPQQRQIDWYFQLLINLYRHIVIRFFSSILFFASHRSIVLSFEPLFLTNCNISLLSLNFFNP